MLSERGPWKVCIDEPFLNCEMIRPIQQKKVAALVSDLSRDQNVQRITIFGSSVTRRCHIDSDVDLYVEVKEDKKLIDHFHHFVFDLLTNFDVDERLENEIMRTGVTVYERNAAG
ncbi:MAG: nucleotidyltransferase domain-containing protein [Oscillospiraceae bacterium]|nr:nucleotidyltransferase domain-containing protein [Oscillospiraceae bacterium]